MHDDTYPVEIDLGREESVDLPSIKTSESSAKNGKKRKFYPTLYIDSVPDLPALPKEGHALIKFRRKRLSVEENSKGEDTTGLTLEIRALCLPEDMAEDGEEDMESAMKKFAENEGVDTGQEEAEDEEKEDEEEKD